MHNKEKRDLQRNLSSLFFAILSLTLLYEMMAFFLPDN